MDTQVHKNVEQAERISSAVHVALTDVVALLDKTKEKVNDAIHTNNNGRQLLASARHIIELAKHPGGAACCLILILVIPTRPYSAPEISQLQSFDDMKNGRYQQAIDGFTEIMAKDGKSVTILGERAYCYYQLNDDIAAINDINEMLKINSQSGRAHFLLGLINKRYGKMELALDEFRLAAHYGDPMAIHQIRSVESKMKRL